jgi:predicted  nucleic acid-binding Zn-ribbon protein
VHPDLEALLRLQDKDVAVSGCDSRLKALEPEVRALDEQLAAAARVVDQARAGIQAALDRRDAMEGKIASYRTMQEQRRQRLEWVRGAKEASTLMAEIDLTRSVLAKEEAEFMRSGDAVSEAEHKAAEAELAFEGVREAQAAVREQLAARRHAIAAERDAAILSRAEAARAVAGSLLNRYDRIRRGKAPLAVYPLHGGSCGNCFTAVPTQRRALIQRGATIESCEACGVLLYASEKVLETKD